MARQKKFKNKPKVGRHYKYSETQMRSYALRSTSINKQAKWMRKLYSQKMNEAKKAGNTERYAHFYKQRANVKINIKKYGIARKDWTIARTDKEIEDVLTHGKISKDGGEHGRYNYSKLILVDDNGDKMFLYEGQAGYDEALKHIKNRMKDDK